MAWLRRLGMPLARIRTVCELAPPEAAGEVGAYWGQVEADIEARRNLATFLIDQLSRKDTVMFDEPDRLGIRYAVRCDRGLVRESNQDVAYAGARLLAVADGFGAQHDEPPASAVAVDALTPLDAAIPAGDLLNVLADAMHDADTAVRKLAASGPSRREVGTTLTALLWSGSQLALVHIGDSRVYLLRVGELFQLTHDHTVVQSLLDEGRRWTNVDSHPQRSMLIRALHAGTGRAEPDVRLHEAQADDRYLLCSDGLHTVLPVETLHQVMSTIPDPEQAVCRLVELANQAGGPDNIACVVADLVTLGD